MASTSEGRHLFCNLVMSSEAVKEHTENVAASCLVVCLSRGETEPATKNYTEFCFAVSFDNAFRRLHALCQN